MYQLSICIPVYNREVKNLVDSLLLQKSSLKESIELVVFDDGSDQEKLEKNHWLKDQKDVRYREMNENLGRSAIRNRLAELAQADYLLFLDDDSKVYRENFLARYLAECNGKQVVCGGRVYTDETPGPDYSLHWNYGQKKESRSASQRSANPYQSFHSNNFLIPKEVWKAIPFDENLSQYGHEDTLLGYELRKAGIPIKHIDNPVIHAQLESNEEFILKSRLAIENLKTLYDRGDKGFNDSVNLLVVYQRLKNLGLRGSVAGLFKTQQSSWENRLTNSANPSLRILNLYKLGYLCSL